MANYTYVVDSSYQPFSLQEMLVPFNAYKEAFEKSEEAYDKLSEADDFKYLSKTLPEGSAARSLYEGYANYLHSQAEDLAQNGLTMSNIRALTSLKRRYRGEIGQLVKADEALKEEKKLRQSLNAQDPERLYATENLSIDDFLEGKNPNLYSISGKDLYARGAQAAKAYSSRVFNTSEGQKTLGGYYIEWIQRNGTSNESIAAFMKNMQSIPEMYNAFNSIMKATGAEKNLTGYNLERAKAEVLNGMVDGFVYQEQNTPQRNLGVMTAAEQSQANLTRRGQNIELAMHGMTYDDKTNTITYDPEKDPILKQKAEEAAAKQGSNSGGGKYPGYTKLQYVPGNGNYLPEDVDKVSSRATQVHIEKSIDTKSKKPIYKVYAGDPLGSEKKGTKLLLGTMDAYGNFILGAEIDPKNDGETAGFYKGKSYDTFGKFFHLGMDGWYQFGHTYDPDEDPKNIKAILRDVINIATKEGSDAYNNYNYYLEPDNTGWNNKGGGFYREPIDRVSGTVFNTDNTSFTGGY